MTLSTSARRSGLIAALLAIGGCVAPAADRATAEAGGAAAPTAPVVAAGNPSVGGVAMPPERSVADNLRAVPDLSMLVSALDAAGLTASLAGAAPLTLFAPTNAAWGRLAPGTLDTLLKPENRATLTRMLRLHLVAGRVTATELIARVAAGGGRATLATLAGESLTVTMTGNIVTLTDAGGNRSYLEVADVREANGVVHVVNGVLVPRL